MQTAMVTMMMVNEVIVRSTRHSHPCRLQVAKKEKKCVIQKCRAIDVILLVHWNAPKETSRPKRKMRGLTHNAQCVYVYILVGSGKGKDWDSGRSARLRRRAFEWVRACGRAHDRRIAGVSVRTEEW